MINNYSLLKQVALAFMIGIGGCNDGYVGVCARAVATTRQDFERTCNEMLDRTLHNGSLDTIVRGREELLRLNDCPSQCERWICERDEYDSYRMRIEKLGTCGEEDRQ